MMLFETQCTLYNSAKNARTGTKSVHKASKIGAKIIQEIFVADLIWRNHKK